MALKIVKNTYQGWKTTVLGLIIVAAAIISMYKLPNITWTEASIPLAIGVLLVLAPDKLITKLSGSGSVTITSTPEATTTTTEVTNTQDTPAP